MKTSADYTPCIVVWPDGRRTKGNVKRSELDSVESARDKLRGNRAAWVTEEVNREMLSGNSMTVAVDAVTP